MWSDSVQNDDPLLDLEGNSVVLDDDN